MISVPQILNKTEPDQTTPSYIHKSIKKDNLDSDYKWRGESYKTTPDYKVPDLSFLRKI